MTRLFSGVERALRVMERTIDFLLVRTPAGPPDPDDDDGHPVGIRPD